MKRLSVGAWLRVIAAPHCCLYLLGALGAQSLALTAQLGAQDQPGLAAPAPQLPATSATTAAATAAAVVAAKPHAAGTWIIGTWDSGTGWIMTVTAMDKPAIFSKKDAAHEYDLHVESGRVVVATAPGGCHILTLLTDGSVRDHWYAADGAVVKNELPWKRVGVQAPPGL